MWIWLAMALVSAQNVTADFDGDGAVETITVTPDGATVAGTPLEECDGYGEGCLLEALDVHKNRVGVQLMACMVGPRDDKACRLYNVKKSGISRISATLNGENFEPDKFTTNGWGVVLGHQWGRLYTRVDKFTLNDAGTALVHVAQPFYAVDKEVKVTTTFPIVGLAKGTDVVANVAPQSTIRVLVESAEDPGWVVVKTSSGLTGWVAIETMVEHSEELMMLWGAG